MTLIKKKNKIQNTTSTEITTKEILEDTLNRLNTYLNDMEQGKVHNPSKHAIFSPEYDTIARTLTIEIENVNKAIKSINKTLNMIKDKEINTEETISL